MENSLARTEASQTRLNHRFTKPAHTFSNLNIEDLQLANVKRRLDKDLKLERLLAVTACHSPPPPCKQALSCLCSTWRNEKKCQ